MGCLLISPRRAPTACVDGPSRSEADSVPLNPSSTVLPLAAGGPGWRSQRSLVGDPNARSQPISLNSDLESDRPTRPIPKLSRSKLCWGRRTVQTPAASSPLSGVELPTKPVDLRFFLGENYSKEANGAEAFPATRPTAAPGFLPDVTWLVPPSPKRRRQFSWVGGGGVNRPGARKLSTSVTMDLLRGNRQVNKFQLWRAPPKAAPPVERIERSGGRSSSAHAVINAHYASRSSKNLWAGPMEDTPSGSAPETWVLCI